MSDRSRTGRAHEHRAQRSSRHPPTTARPPTGSGEAVTLAFAGDASFEGLDGRIVTDPASVLAPVAPVLSSADLSMLNLEAALGTEGGAPEPKAFNFRTPAQAIEALGAAGVDVVSMANNHGMDYGPEAFERSLQIRDQTGFPVIGVGRNDAEAYRPYVTTIEGQRIGIIAANDVFDDHLRHRWTAGATQPGIASAEEAHQDRLAEEVRRTRAGVDTLVVYLHFGLEKELCPNQRQRDLVSLLTAAGADVVVGAHVHRIQGAGFQGDRLVAYGLGNFAFQASSAEGSASGVLKVRATGRRIDAFEWIPATIRGAVPHPDPDPGPGLDVMAERRACAGLTDTPIPPVPPSPPPAPLALPAPVSAPVSASDGASAPAGTAASASGAGRGAGTVASR